SSDFEIRVQPAVPPVVDSALRDTEAKQRQKDEIEPRGLVGVPVAAPGQEKTHDAVAQMPSLRKRGGPGARMQGSGGDAAESQAKAAANAKKERAVDTVAPAASGALEGKLSQPPPSASPPRAAESPPAGPAVAARQDVARSLAVAKAQAPMAPGVAEASLGAPTVEANAQQARHAGNYLAAASLYREAAAMRQRGNDSSTAAWNLAHAVECLSAAGQFAEARKVRDRWQTVNVLCAKVDVAEGTELTESMVAFKEMPATFVTESFIRTDEHGAVERHSPVGQRVMVPLKAGDPILASHFESARETDLASLITPKGRAVTIDVQEKNAVGLWVRPNDHVDVIGSFRDPQTQQLRTMTLLQNVVVLATGRITANSMYVAEEDKRFATVTVLALPEEAEMLTLAQELGTLTLLLRNPDDLDSQEKRSVVDQKVLFTGDRA